MKDKALISMEDYKKYELAVSIDNRIKELTKKCVNLKDSCSNLETDIKNGYEKYEELKKARAELIGSEGFPVIFTDLSRHSGLEEYRAVSLTSKEFLDLVEKDYYLSDVLEKRVIERAEILALELSKTKVSKARIRSFILGVLVVGLGVFII